MVQIFRSAEAEVFGKKGYTAKYVADVTFQRKLDSGGFIMVTVAKGSRTKPHKHEKLEEVFVALSDLKMYIDSIEYMLEKGDVVLVAPDESHSFEASDTSLANLIAIKFPNIKNDKVSIQDQ